MDELHTLLDETAASPPVESLTRLIAALWTINDPFCGSRRRGLHLLIAADYTDIATLPRHGADELLDEAQNHRNRAEEWH